MKRYVCAILLVMTALVVSAAADGYGYVTVDFPAEVRERYDEIGDTVWEWVSQDPDAMFAVYKEDGCGVIDRAGNEVVPCAYDWFNYFGDGNGTIALDDKMGIVNLAHGLVTPLVYDATTITYTNGVFSLYKDGLAGYVDSDGEEICAFIYEDIAAYDNGLGMVIQDGKAGFVGETTIPCVYDGMYLGYDLYNANYRFFSDWAAVRLDEKWGYIDKQGNTMIPFLYEETEAAYDGGALIAVKLDGMWGYIDRDGETALPFRYTKASGFTDGFATVVLDGAISTINTDGDVLSSIPYEEINENFFWSFGEEFSNYAAVCRDGLWGIATADLTEEIIPCMYEDISVNQNDSKTNIKAMLDGKWGYINIENEVVFPFIMDTSMMADEGLICFRADGLWGYMDMCQRMIVAPTYIQASSFSGGMARVQQRDGKWGFIDKTGAWLVAPVYDDAKNFSCGLAAVQKDGLWGFVDVTGKLVIEPAYSYVDPFGFYEGLSYVADARGLFIMNRLGEAMTEPVPMPDDESFLFNEVDTSLWAENPDVCASWVAELMRHPGYPPPMELKYNFRSAMTRREVAVLLQWAYPIATEGTCFGYPDIPSPFTDTDDPDVISTCEAGLMQGVGDGLFAPDEEVTRQDFAVCLYRMAQMIGADMPETAAKTFADDAEIADYAREAVDAMVAWGVMGGDGIKLYPTDPVTREQAIVMAWRLIYSV
ncbi:MAG: WG repeat-containing protein [Oscillospiraceae bacterium]|nr:WG repeat-containing protein [Oscillospiraceae bacterium]